MLKKAFDMNDKEKAYEFFLEFMFDATAVFEDDQTGIKLHL